jgi:hypothetical protein
MNKIINLYFYLFIKYSNFKWIIQISARISVSLIFHISRLESTLLLSFGCQSFLSGIAYEFELAFDCELTEEIED